MYNRKQLQVKEMNSIIT